MSCTWVFNKSVKSSEIIDDTVMSHSFSLQCKLLLFTACEGGAYINYYIIINGFPSAQLQKLTGPSLVKKSVKAPSWASSSCINISIWPFRYSYKLCQYHINVYRNLWHPHDTSVYWDKVPQVKRNYPRTGSHTRTVVIYSHSFWSKHIWVFFSVKYQMWKHC